MLVFAWQFESISAGSATGDDGYFVDRISVGKKCRNDCMSGFMVGNDFLFFFTKNMRASFWSEHHLLYRLKKVLLGYLFEIFPCSQNSPLVYKICQVSARETG